MNNAVRKIDIFDFDGTLIDSPEPTQGRLVWKEKTGEDFPYKEPEQKGPQIKPRKEVRGWWGRNESLDMDVFDIKPNMFVVSDYRISKAEEGTLTIMMTGRIPKNEPAVRKILDANGLDFDMYVYKTNHDTLLFKLDKLDSFLAEYPNLEEIVIWEDRPEHSDGLEAWGADKEIDVIVNRVS